jgi:alpha-L-fucosidase
MIVKKHLSALLLQIICGTLIAFSTVSEEPGSYKTSWKSVMQHPTPDWFRDAKFGIYCHWGPYSVPAYETEWYSHYMYVKGHKCNKHHVETYGPLNEFGYKDFIPMFKAEKWKPDEWAKLFQKAGARFAGLAVEHADGFALWDSDLTEWDAADMGPKRDVVKDIAKAIKNEGLKFVATYHRQWLYAWYPTLDRSTDASDPAYAGLYGPPVPTSAFGGSNKFPDPLPDKKFSEQWLNRIIEVVDKYQPDMVWFDNKLNILHEMYRLKFLSYYYNKGLEWNKDVAATYKANDFHAGAGILDLERSRMSEGKDFPWLTDDSMDWKSWCYISEPDYKSTDRLIDTLVDIVSKNGCVLLNVPPKANGEFPQPVIDRLLQMGRWLDLNGEAIYETRPWKVFGEGPAKVVEGHLSERKNTDATAEDIRFTCSKDGKTLYVTFLGWPGAGRTSLVRSLANSETNPTITSISMIGCDDSITWKQTKNGLSIVMPDQTPFDEAICFKLTVQ